MSDLPPKEPDEHCNARKVDGSGYCQHTAGWGTDHTNHGRCKYHGGNTEAQEKSIIKELEDAAEDASVAIRLALKHEREAAEAGEEVNWKKLDRLGRTAFDRTDNGPTEKREVNADVDAELSLDDVTIDFTDTET